MDIYTINFQDILKAVRSNDFQYLNIIKAGDIAINASKAVAIEDHGPGEFTHRMHYFEAGVDWDEFKKEYGMA